MDDAKNIQRGFNQGYLLQKHKPELAKAISEGVQDKDNPYQQGFLAGVEEYSKERELTKSKKKSKFDLPHRNIIPKSIKVRDKDERIKDLGDREK